MKDQKNVRIVIFIYFFLATHCLVFAQDSGVWRGSLDINLNGSVTTYYDGVASGTPLSGANLGAITSTSTLTLQNPYLFSFKNGGCDVTSGRMFYRIYRVGVTPPSYSTYSAFTFNCDCANGCWRSGFGCGTGDQELGNSSAGAYVNLLALAKANDAAPGTYNFDVYWEISSSCGTKTRGTSGSPIRGTFTAAAALPVEISSFRARSTVSSIDLYWETASEHNNNYFEIQRSTDAHNWTALEKVSSQNGDAQYNQSYTYTDQRPAKNVNYYRLRQVDFDGKFEYSKVVQARVGVSLGVQVSPNPVSETLWLTLESETQTSASRIQILDSYGRLLKEWNLNEVPAQQAFPLDLSDIPSGLLFLQIDSQEARRIVKQ